VIVGVGIDVVGVARFAASLQRSPALAARLFTPAERMSAAGRPRSAESLAARFAAKEALAKAVGSPGTLRWHDAEVTVLGSGQPVIAVTGTVAAWAARLGVDRWHLALAHDAGIATAVVVAESLPTLGGDGRR
jgi:holo-[acyl-carrier protein] synthase